jgi:hypothetical protein
MSSLEPMASAPPYVMRSVFPDTLVFSDEMAYRALVPGDKIAADPATRRPVDRFQSTIWYDPDRHLMHYMIRGGECLNAVAIVPWPRDRREVDRIGDADELVDAFPGWDDRIAVMLSKAERDASAWAMDRCPIWCGWTALTNGHDHSQAARTGTLYDKEASRCSAMHATPCRAIRHRARRRPWKTPPCWPRCSGRRKSPAP